MKKFTAVLLSVLLLASSLPISALAAEASEASETVAADIVKTEPETTDRVTKPIENTITSDNEKSTEATPAKAVESVGAKPEEQPVGKSSFTYTVANNQVTITGLSDEYLTDLVIPETIEDLPVTAIKENSFSGCSQITNITVPNSVNSIGNGAFKGTNPIKVSLPFIGSKRGESGSFSSVFGYVFGQVSSLENTIVQRYKDSNIMYYSIPKTIKEVVITDETVIPYGAFYNCSWVESIEINDTATVLKSFAFYNCQAMKSVSISKDLESISDSCFYGCSALEDIEFPEKIDCIGVSAFYGCSSLAFNDLIIPDKVKTIGDDAFSGCCKITSITVPSNVTLIGKGAFKGTNPTKVSLPFIGSKRGESGSFSSVFGYVFGQGGLTENTVVQCYKDSNILYYTIPKSIKEVVITDETVIPYGAFYNCSWVESIEINDTATVLKSFAFYNCQAMKSVSISKDLESFSDSCFYGCLALEDIEFPENIDYIGVSAFYGCSSLAFNDLIIPDKVKTIGDDAFSGCSKITNITVPNSVNSIGNGAFKGTNPTKVILPFIGSKRGESGSFSSVFGYVFGQVSSLENTIVQRYKDSNIMYYSIPKTIKEVVISDETIIPHGAFYNCDWIEKVTINDIEGDASKVGTDAFYNCKAMTVYINRDTALHTYCERNSIRHCSTKSISLDSDSLVLFRNEAKTIGSEVVLLNGKVDTEPETVWTSSNPEVASVDRYTGVISAVAPGTATITADSEGVTKAAEVTVYFKLDGITLNKATTEIDIDKTETLTVIYNPANTTDSKEITWTSSDDSIASVDENGVVTAHQKGNAIITVIGFGGVRASCMVQVLVPMTEITFENCTVTIPRGTRQKVPFTASPSDTTDTYTVTSSDTDIATVDRFGTVVAKKIGTVIITVTSSRGLAESCVVTVNSPASSVTLSPESQSLFVGKTVALTVEMLPKDTTDSITWTSSNEDVAVVTSNGLVTAIAKGTATITATADSGISSSCEVEVESDIAATTVLLAYQETEYDGSEKLPAVDVYYNGDKLVEGTDYSLSYLNNTNAVTASVFVTSLHDGTEVEKQFVIKPLTVKALDISSKAVVTYTGKALKALEEVTYQSLRLTEGVDYTVTYENNTNAGAATVTITGKGNFCDAITKTFTIAPKSANLLTVTLSESSYDYDGNAKMPGITVKDGNKTLKEGTDYSVSYSKNTHAGDAVVKVTGLNNYGSATTASFKIYPKSISDAMVTLNSIVFAYDGADKRPEPRVEDNGVVLREGVDYRVAFKDNQEAGIATATIIGQNDYTGTLAAEFSIIQPGDIDRNGVVNIQDATILQFHLAEFVNSDGTPIIDEDNEEIFKIADVNHSGNVTIADVTFIQRYLAELINLF